MRSTRKTRVGIITGINIAPLTDVVLVLLVIFMVATPLLISSEIKVNLPNTTTADTAAERTLVVTIDGSGGVFVDGVRVALADLSASIASAHAKRPNAPVIIMGDKAVRYELVVRVLEIARATGVTKLSLAVEVKK